MSSVVDWLEDKLYTQTSNAPLVVFRIVFGCLLVYSTLRMIQMGWVQELYIDPTYHFPFVPGIEPLGEQGMYLVFYAKLFFAICIALGLFYRVSTISFLLLFVYVELIDKALYLNHYYLVSLLVFWLVFVPANRRCSLDALIFPSIRRTTCAAWCILVFKVQLSIVYFFAGFAKVNSDWLFRAQPLATWLPSLYQIPIIGGFMHLKAVAFLFSWAGCLYDLTIWLFMWSKKWRVLGYFFVVVFHVLTGILFPRIGMFPYIMMTSTLIFFSSDFYEGLLSRFSDGKDAIVEHVNISRQPMRWLTYGFLLYFAVQIILPFRYLQYGGNIFWHEKGYRFSWRVMLMEKSGTTAIIVKDPKTNKQFEVDQEDYLSAFQRKQMRSQPDMIRQFANHIGDEFYEKHGYAPAVHVKSRMALNARRSRPYTDESINIYQKSSAELNTWILPFEK